MRLILAPRQSKEARLALMDIPRDFSSSSASETVVPSATEPSRVVAPASNSRASISDVFPLPRWPTNATLRILSAAAWGMPAAPLLWPAPAREAGMMTCAGPYSPAPRQSVAEVVPLQAALEPQYGLGVELRDARLRDA